MLGISIYPEYENEKDTIEYIKLASKYGFKRVFTCLLSVNESKDKITEKFKKIISVARENDMEVIFDVAPTVFKQLDISYDDLSFFHKLGATGIRLDEGFDGLKEALMTYNKYDLDIEINMSNGTKYVDNILSYSANKKKLIGCHNFYPMEFSGLSLEHFEKTSLQFKELGIRSAAFVSSSRANHGPWPVMDSGLCTLEMHRNLPITTQVKHHLMMGLVDDIIIANAFASEEELKEISEIKCPTFEIKFNPNVTDIEKKIVLEELHFNRGDISEYLIRSTNSRIKFKNENFKPENTSEIIKKGEIIICNNNFERYKGELQLIKKDHDDVKRRKNIVAKIAEHELFLLDYLKPWSLFKFVEIKKKKI
ncbi:MAG: DUF871 domain-containing protein [Mycoplasma sp.]|nr:DUF871 domain-containing protein [Mycoplasma sp.]